MFQPEEELSTANSSPPPLPKDSNEVFRGVAVEITEAIDRLKEFFGENELATLVNSVIDRKDLRKNLPKGVPTQMIHLLGNFVDKAPVAPMSSDDETRQTRRLAAAQFLTDVLNNEFKTPGKRWAANLTNVGLRTGIVVTLCLLVREALAFALAKDEALEQRQEVMQAAGIAMIVLTLALHIIGLAGDLYSKDKKSKLGSSYSMIMRVAMCLFTLATLLACYSVGTINNLVTRASSILTYCFARDLCNLFFKLGNNVETLPKRALLGSGMIYGMVQFLASFLPDQVAPLAGAKGVPKLGQLIAAENRNITLEDIHAAGLNLSDTYLKAMLNALADMSDDVVAPALLRHFETADLLMKSEYRRFDERKYEELEVSIGKWADELFDLPSDELRRQELTRYSWALYGILLTHLKNKNKEFGKLSRDDQRVLDELLDRDFSAPDRNLPPVSHVVFGDRTLPDFSTFKSTLVDTLNAVAKKVEKESKTAIPPKVLKLVAKEVYRDALIDAYMPLRTSDLQDELRRALLRQDPALLPYVLRTLLAKKTKETREQSEMRIQDGLRVTLTLANPWKDADFGRRAFTALTTTSAARQNFYILVFGAVYAFGNLVNDHFKDDPLIASVLESLVVMVAVIVYYQFFYGMHDRRPTPQGRQLLPGGDGARDLPKLPNAEDLARAIHDAGVQARGILDGGSPGGSSISSASSN